MAFGEAVTFLLGNIGSDPEVNTVGSGDDATKVANLSLAVSKSVPDGDGGYEDRTTWYNDVAVWGRDAEYIEQVASKGDSLFLEGEMQENSYTRNDGTEVESMKVVHRSHQRLQVLSNGGSSAGGKSPEEELAEESGGPPSNGSDDTVTDDDLPF
jgi:single-strand DNA-binding protein